MYMCLCEGEDGEVSECESDGWTLCVCEGGRGGEQ